MNDQIRRVLIVGNGSIGKRHLKIARSILPEADIRILRHRQSGHSGAYDDWYFFSLDDALQFSAQVAIIANPSTLHLQIAQVLAERGVHLLVEKPLSSSSDGVLELIETSKKHNIVLMTGYNLRFLPSLIRYRELIAQGEVGKVLSVRCETGQYLPLWRPNTDYRLGVSARQELGGGVLLELSHELDYLRWIFGEIEWVMASLSRQSSLEIDVEDTAHLVLGFASQANGNQPKGVVTLDFIRHDTTRSCTAIGESGTLRWDGITGFVTVHQAGDMVSNVVLQGNHQRDDSYIAEWLHFLSCVKDSSVPLVTGEDGLRVIEIIEAARKSSETGHRIVVARSENIDKQNR